MNKDVCDRLAAYEDTGLEPEDLKRAFNEDDVLKLAGQALGITPERLRELAQTDKDGKIKAYIVDSFYCDICQKRHARTKEYEVWCSMRARCNRKTDKRYDHYGGRGISVCEEWSDFVAFRNWALKNGYQEGLTIDRIDNDGPYSPENCRWTTKKVQNNNQSTTTIIKVGDVEKPLHIWADFIGIPPEALRRRLYDGWNVERALFEKIDTTKCPKKYRAALRREQDG
jgi:hypothetical protein